MASIRSSIVEYSKKERVAAKLLLLRPEHLSKKTVDDQEVKQQMSRLSIFHSIGGRTCESGTGAAIYWEPHFKFIKALNVTPKKR